MSTRFDFPSYFPSYFPMLIAIFETPSLAQDQLVQQLQISSRPTANKLSRIAVVSRKMEWEERR